MGLHDRFMTYVFKHQHAEVTCTLPAQKCKLEMWECHTVLSSVQKGKACGEREVGVGDEHSIGIGSLAAPRITPS